MRNIHVRPRPRWREVAIRDLKRRRGRERQQKIRVRVYEIIFRSLQLVLYVKCARTVKEFKLEGTRFISRERTESKVKFNHFTSLFWRGRQRNVPKCEMQVQCVQNYCFFLSLNVKICSVSLSSSLSLLKVPNAWPLNQGGRLSSSLEKWPSSFCGI